MQYLLKWKVGVIFSLFCIFTIASIIGCRSDKTEDADTVKKEEEEKADSEDTSRYDRRKKLSCSFSACSSDDSACCDADDNECHSWCAKDLDFRERSNVYEDCMTLKRNELSKLVYLFEEELKRPKPDDLAKLKREDINLICAAVKELDFDVLDDRIDRYKNTYAMAFLEWTAENEDVVEVFENALKDTGVRMFRKLLHAVSDVSDGITDRSVLAGLAKNVVTDADEGDADDERNVLALALEENNDRLVSFVHEEIISSSDELCSKGNRPVPDTTQDIDSEEPGVQAYPDENYANDACVLAVYCTIAPTGNRDNAHFRKDIAEEFGRSGVSSFIESELKEGGLGGTDDDGEEWSDYACTQLKQYWNEGQNNLGFDL